MGILKRRPEIVFDATNPEHRAYYHNFRVNNTWNGSPRFVLEDQFTNVPDMIAFKMLSYYMASEFKDGDILKTAA